LFSNDSLLEDLFDILLTKPSLVVVWLMSLDDERFSLPIVFVELLDLDVVNVIVQIVWSR